MTQTAAAHLAVDGLDIAGLSAARAGVEIRELDDLTSMQNVSKLFDEVWTDPTGTIMPVNLIRALAAAGNYVAGAFLEGRMVGAILGFTGLHGGDLVVHSHILGVLAETQGRNVGFALKHHQRAWCLDRGITTVLWTFDPLVRRNAYFNLSKLGAVARRYEVNFYGPMSDGINAGDETDRLVITWDLTDPRVLAAAQGQLEPASDGAVLLDIGADDAPVVTKADGPVLRCRVPENILQLRAADPALALRWRHALRDTLGEAVHDGYVASGMDRAGWYTLTKPDVVERHDISKTGH